MKRKYTLLIIIISAIITLSFTFSNPKSKLKRPIKQTIELSTPTTAPIGGFISEGVE